MLMLHRLHIKQHAVNLQMHSASAKELELSRWNVWLGVQAIEKSNGLTDYSKLKDTALFNMVCPGLPSSSTVSYTQHSQI